MDKKTSSFKLPCLRRLKKRLGEYDSLVEYLELATRKFKSDFKSQTKLSFSEYISIEAKEQNICLNDLTLDNYETFKNKYYLILPYAAFGSFLADFKKDFIALFDQKGAVQQYQAKLDSISDFLEREKFSLGLDTWSINLYNYYRLLRNSLAHDSNKTINEINKIYSSIDKKDVQKAFGKDYAPHDWQNLDFNDFILFTANIKYIAEKLTLSLESHVDWVDFSKRNLSMFPKRKKYENNRSRFIVYVRNVISKNYGLSLNDSEIEDIINITSVHEKYLTY